MRISPTSSEVRVVHRNLRWEVAVDGRTRRMIDWLCTKERAIDHAVERAREVARREGRAVTVVVPAGTAAGGTRFLVEPEGSSAAAE